MRMSFAWARFVLLAGLVLTMGSSCSLATTTRIATGQEAPVLPHPTLLSGNLGVTTCSYNNLPVILMDSAVLVSPDAEIILAHEQKHASRMRAYLGGCFGFLLRYRGDTAFRADEEFIAYCAEGQFALRRNRSPEFAWARIKEAMLVRHDRLLGSQDNCLFREVPTLKEEGLSEKQ